MRKFVLIICLIHSLYSFSVPFGCVIFNELMVDPEPTVGLPDVEYIELYNRSAQAISLKGWTLFYGEKAYAFPDSRIDSAGFALLCPLASGTLFPSGKPLIEFVTFPTLANTGKQMYLVNEKKELVTCLEYSSGWYGDDFKAKGGWSLECIDADNLSGNASNWTSSKDLSGGTPGCANSISAINPDEAYPVCTALYVLSPKQLELNFSKVMQAESLTSVLNFGIDPSINMVTTVTPDFPNYHSVKLNLSDSLIGGRIYSLTLSNLKDVSSLPLKNSSISFGLPETPEFFDLSLNELLFNPTSNGCDYVEFVNISDKCVDLSKVWISSRSESGAIGAGFRLSEKPLPCIPGSYWLVSANVDSVLSVTNYPAIANAIDLTSFPSMPDASGNVLLLTTAAQIIDEMNYKESMHFPLMSNCEGVSLEKLNPSLSSVGDDFWTSASLAMGYGTPGFQNSQFRDLSEVKENGFYMDQNWMTPNDDGADDLISISYKVAESSMADLAVYDLNGRIVRTLLKNELLSAAGSVFWDGTANDGSLAPAGRYILYVNWFSPKGQRNKKRFVLTVLF